MRLLLLTHEFPPFNGGIGTYAYELARAACEVGHDVRVVAPGYSAAARDGGYDEPFRVSRFPGGQYSARHFPLLLRTLLKALVADRYDLVHAMDWPFALALGFCNKFGSFPFVCTVHGTELLHLHRSRHLKLLGLRSLYRAADRIFANSEYTKGLLLEKCPYVDQEAVAVTRLGVSEWWFERPGVGEREGILAKLSVPRGARVITTVSRLTERKGHLATLAALARLPREARRDVFYVVAGPHDDRAYLRRLHDAATACGVPTIVAGALARTEVRALLAASSMFCMPGLPSPQSVEGFGLAYLEAAAQGVPSLASRLGGAPEAVVDGATGLVVAPGDVEGLGDALALLLADASRREAMGRRAREHARDHSWRRVALRTYDRTMRALPEAVSS